jgi:dihydrofolate reductase
LAGPACTNGFTRPTTFHFVTDGIQAALRRATEAAGGLDVGLGGGPATIRQYLQAGLVDHMHLAVSPVLLGSGESLLAGINLLELGYQISEHASSPAALHVVLTKQNKEPRSKLRGIAV